MAGDWIKVEHVTADKPEIYRIAAALGVSPEDAFGRCIRIWIWADQQSLDGHAVPVTFVTLDSIARRDGFAQAMLEVGWLEIDGAGAITFPNFDRHNGKTSKDRALATDRKRRERLGRDNCHDDVANTSRSERDDIVTREEKRREEDSPLIPPEGDDGFDGWFEKWWARYPRYRRGPKEPAKKKIHTILTKRRATRAALDAGLDRYLVAGYGDSTSACGALVFLNQERWTIEDFAPPVDKKPQGKPQFGDECPLTEEERMRLRQHQEAGRV